MKITIMNNKLVPLEEIAYGTIFRDPAGDIYYIKTTSVVDEDTGEEKWNSLRLDNTLLTALIRDIRFTLSTTQNSLFLDKNKLCSYPLFQ